MEKDDEDNEEPDKLLSHKIMPEEKTIKKKCQALPSTTNLSLPVFFYSIFAINSKLFLNSCLQRMVNQWLQTLSLLPYTCILCMIH